MPDKKVFKLACAVNALGNRRGEVMVYSTISRYKWDRDDPTVTSNEFDKQLKALGDVDEITVRINSPGGSVGEAIAIRTTLIKHPAKKTIDIEGCCDSAATLIACLPGAYVRMAKGAEYMIHRCSAGAWGHADDLMSMVNSMNQTDRDMADIYAARTGKTADECYELMKAETWFGAETAKEAGFVDEVLTGEAEDDMVACAVDAEAMELMRACYAHAPEHAIREADKPNGEEPEGEEKDSHGFEAVAHSGPTDNNDKGEREMPELKDVTAEMLEQENPELAKTIAQRAREAERERLKAIDDLTPDGADYRDMAKDAKENGTSAADYFKKVLEKQRAKGAEFVGKRKEELKPAEKIDGGDSGDHDDKDGKDKLDKDAADIAALAKDMNADVRSMA